MKITKVKIIKNSKGAIYKIHSAVRSSKKIKEIYFNKLSSKRETLWIRHKIATCNFYIVKGSCKIETVSKKKNKKNIISRTFSDIKITIKAGNWFKIINTSNEKLIILIYLDTKHRKHEFEKRKKI